MKRNSESPNRPSISVVIPAYNRETTLLAAIRSVLSQGLSPSEVIIVDDGSTDGTAAIVNELKHPIVRLIRQANGGAAAARNTGILAATSEWIAFQDSDDEWLPSKLERQFSPYFSQGPAPEAFYCGMVIVNSLGGHHNRAKRQSVTYHPDPALSSVSGNLLPSLLRASLISTQTLIVRRQTLIDIGMFDEKLKALEDWDLAIRLARLGQIGFVDEPLVVQRFSINSLTRETEKHIDAWIYILNKHMELFETDSNAHLLHLRRIAGGLRRLGKHDAAHNWFRKASSVDPFNLRCTIGRILNSLRI